MEKLTHGSLFSGIGGFDLAAEWSGISTAWNCEILEYNRQILKNHFPETIQFEDIREMVNIPKVDIISGGFPCQDISISNQSKKNEEKGIKGKRSGLWSEMFRIIRDVRPKYVIIENSPAITIRGLETVLCNLSEIGYYAEWQCLSASMFGYPHKRERFYCVAYSERIGQQNNSEIFRELPEVLRKRSSRQNTVPMPSERFNTKSDFGGVQLYDGFSKELDKQAIAAFGNAVVPDIPHYIFECIKLHNQQIYGNK